LPGEDLLLYIAVTTYVVSSAIVVERSEEGHAFGVQRPVYFISEVLSESKIRYPVVQKLLYAILIASRKLRQYFDEYKITVDEDINYNTSTSTPAAPFPATPYAPSGPITRARARELNFVMLLKNEGPEE
jgi:hypothetical protein